MDLGAEGIGLCRTEHMFFAEDRIKAVREMICARTVAEREAALAKVEPFKQGDFEAMYRIMGERPMTIRYLDPPLHELDVYKRQALGFNLLRKHAKIEPQRWYYHCDRLGLVVWQDMVCLLYTSSHWMSPPSSTIRAATACGWPCRTPRPAARRHGARRP